MYCICGLKLWKSNRNTKPLSSINNRNHSSECTLILDCIGYHVMRSYVLTSHLQPDHSRGGARGVCGHTGIFSGIHFLHTTDFQRSKMDILLCKWHCPQIKISWRQMVKESKKTWNQFGHRNAEWMCKCFESRKHMENILQSCLSVLEAVILHLHSYHHIELDYIWAKWRANWVFCLSILLY